MKNFKVVVYGWHTEENPKGPILREEFFKAENHFDAWSIAEQIWRQTRGSIAYKMDQVK